METSFYIEEKNLDDIKKFIRLELKTARFKHNPIKIGKDYNISLKLSVQDCNKLSKYREAYE